MRLTFHVAFGRQGQFLPGAICALAALLTASGPARAEPATDARQLTADVVCTVRKTDRQFGYRYRYDVTLSMRHGTVRRLKLSQRATSKHGDDQGCQIGLDDLEQVPAESGILLRAAGADAKPRCTVRITADRKQIRIQISAAAEEGNDCRGSDDTMYCSPRSFWADMVVERGSKRCQPVH